MRILLLSMLLLSGLSFSTYAYGYKNPCNKKLERFLLERNTGRLGPKVFSRYKGSSTRSVRKLKVATINTYEKLKKLSENKRRNKNFRHLIEFASFIMHNDVIALQEVDSFKSLQYFNKHLLGDQYRIFFLQSNDTNMSHMGFLVRKDLPVDVELKSHKFYKQFYRDRVVNIFSRDLPFLMFRHPGQVRSEKPFLTFAGIHYKSMGHSKGDDFSMKKRSLQVDATADIIQRELYGKFGRVPLVVLGDFNAEVSSREFELLRKQGLRETLELSGFTHNNRITHNYFSRDGDMDRKQMDALMVNDINKISVLRSKVFYYKNRSDQEIPLPQNIDERSKLPSDHYPVWAEIELSDID